MERPMTGKLYTIQDNLSDDAETEITVRYTIDHDDIGIHDVWAPAYFGWYETSLSPAEEARILSRIEAAHDRSIR